jgi:hypothetical protein
MKRTIISLFCIVAMIGISVSAFAQEDKSKRPSPPAEAKGIIDGSDITVNYSSPAVKGRMIWGGLVPYGKVWRTGANEATVFETSKDIVLSGQTLPAGKYALFTIPGENEWTVIFNSDWNQWGAFKYNKDKDVLRLSVRPDKSASFNERLKFEVIDDEVVMYWENLQVGFPVGK